MGRPKILVVEKDDHIREVIAGILSRSEDTLMVIQTGREDDLFRIAEITALDVILIDAGMALRTRETITEIIRKRPGIRVFITAYDDISCCRELAAEVGATAVLQKDRIVSDMKSISFLSDRGKKGVNGRARRSAKNSGC